MQVDQKPFFGSTAVRMETEVLVIERFENCRNAFFTLHKVSSDGEMELSGKTIDPVLFLSQLVKKKENKTNVKFLDSRVLIEDEERLVWFDEFKKTLTYTYLEKIRDFRVKMPNLIFSFNKRSKSLRVACVANGRPNEQSQLYAAPIPNVADTGSICLGSVKLKSSDTIDEITEKYFNSNKTHLNNNRLLRGKAISNEQYFQWLLEKEKSGKKIKISELSRLSLSMEEFIGTGLRG